jgi:predicted CoA-substrate-specific enzyme activase
MTNDKLKNTEAKSILGIDVGSTTVKMVLLDVDTKTILWKDYQRHETKQAAKTLELLEAMQEKHPRVAQSTTRAFITGSGAGSLTKVLGASFVQEVVSVTLAVEEMHPDAGSVIELGGQDAKIINFKINPKTGEKQPICSMNDKCASGTGATIDKCLIKIGISNEDAVNVEFDGSKLHKVAAKCGVFAETDIVNLVKSGVDAKEILCSLADAIVHQNLSVLARGSTLKSKVILLGGPNAFLKVMQQCWRLRIPETWEDRNYDYDKEVPLEDLIEVPDNSQYYAAYGAAVYGLDEPETRGIYRGLEAFADFVHNGSKNLVKEGIGDALVSPEPEQKLFIEQYTIPDFHPASITPNTIVKGYVGLDGGSTSSKAVLLDEKGQILTKSYRLSKGNPLEDMKELMTDLKNQIEAQGAKLEIAGFGVTGYAGDVLEESIKCDVNIVETVAHMRSAVHFFDDVDVICDIGGQDIKVLLLTNGDIRDFRLSNQCSAGNGMLLQAMADQFGIAVEDYADVAFKASATPNFSYGCAVFLDSDRVNFQKEGYSKEELLGGLARVLPKNVWQYVVQIPRMAELGKKFVLQGGTQKNLAAVKAQVDYIKDRVPGAEVFVHPHSGEAGAIGAGMESIRVVKMKGKSTFIGLEKSIDLSYTTRNDESTVCHFCPNQCARTFVDSVLPDGNISRYISGFSCERGTVESKEVMVELVKERKNLKKKYVNLLEYEARTAFKTFYTPEAFPEQGSKKPDTIEEKNIFKRLISDKSQNYFERSSDSSIEKRKNIRIGIPRVLNLYSTAPLFRTYFETLGIKKSNVVFSPVTSEELFQEGAKYGSIDPCFPSKVAQAHIHDLIFKKHPKRPLDYIFFPTITHVPTFVEFTMESTSCPIVAGTPNVIKAAFTKETDYFATHNIEYVDGSVNLLEKNYLKKQMFEMWADKLDMTKDESDFAVDEGWKAIEQFSRDLERRGLEILQQVEDENRVALLVIGRPYHADPGLNHDIIESFQSLGYPVLTIRSIPKDFGWLSRWFESDLEEGKIDSPLDIRDVWPENYSANSVQKVWAAKFAARHPNVAVLDLSSFKCGHDAPTYGLIDSIIKGGKSPYMALHDLDANKPAGSIKIRVKTYGYTLKRYEEELQMQSEKRSELEEIMLQKRRKLISERQEALNRVELENPETQKELKEMKSIFTEYINEEEAVFGITESDLDKKFMSNGPLQEQEADIAPLPPEIQEILASKDSRGKTLPVIKTVSSGGCSANPNVTKFNIEDITHVYETK